MTWDMLRQAERVRHASNDVCANRGFVRKNLIKKLGIVFFDICNLMEHVKVWRVPWDNWIIDLSVDQVCIATDATNTIFL